MSKTALSQDGIRGLSWFLHGANNVIVPRGVFFDSKLFQSVNTSMYNGSSPLAGATVYGNSNKVGAHLNSRVIQMVVTRNLTLEQAYRILDAARTNTTNVVTAFSLTVTDEWYTLGLAREVDDLAANTVVENSGNYTAPPPSPTQWELFWNTLAGIANAVWNAVVAVGQFFYNVGRWLVQAFIGLVKGLTTGDWTDFKNQVLEPLRQALEALVKFIIDLAKAAFDLLFGPILNALAGYIDSIRAVVGTIYGQLIAENPSAEEHAKRAGEIAVVAFLGGTFALLLALGLAIAVVEAITKPFNALVGAMIPILAQIGIGMILGAVAVSVISVAGSTGFAADNWEMIPEFVIDFIPSDSWLLTRIPLTIGRFVATIMLLSLRMGLGKEKIPLVSQVRAIGLAYVGLVLFAVGQALSPGPEASAAAVLGFLFSVLGLYYAYASPHFKAAFPIIYNIALFLALASFALASVSLARAG